MKTNTRVDIHSREMLTPKTKVITSRPSTKLWDTEERQGTNSAPRKEQPEDNKRTNAEETP